MIFLLKIITFLKNHLRDINGNDIKKDNKNNLTLEYNNFFLISRIIN